VWSLSQPVGKPCSDTSNLLDSKLLSDPLQTFVFLDRHVRHEATAFEAEDKENDASRDVIVTFARRPLKSGYDFGKSSVSARSFSTSSTSPPKRVGVVGCGPSGMALINACSKLQDPSSVSLTIFEKQEEWGGVWNYDWRTGSDESGRAVHASMYQQLWSNSAKETNEFLDYSYEEHFEGKATPSYLPRQLMRDYIAGRAEKAMGVDGVNVDVRLGSGVEQVEMEGGKFRVTTGGEKEEEFDHLIVASGHFSVPHSASFPGFENFNGRIMHSTDFRNALEFSGHRILVVGNGNSGEDVALQCNKYGAAQVYLTYRTEKSAINWPEGIEETPNLVSVGGEKGRTCYLKDGSEIEDVDAIILCTGYKHSFPYMPNDLRLSTSNNLYPQGLYKGVAWLENPNLFYMGMQDIWIGLKVYDCQAFWIMDSILGKVGRDAGVEERKGDIERWVDKLKGIKREGAKEGVNGLRENLNFQKEYLQDILDDVGETAEHGYNKDYRALLDTHVDDYMMVTEHKREVRRSDGWSEATTV